MGSTVKQNHCLSLTSDLLGQTFLVKHKGEGELATAKIIREITDRDSRLADHPERKRFLASVYDDEFQEVVTHNEILDHITQQEETKEPTDLWRFQPTSGHQGLLKSTDKDYNGSPYNVQVEWVNEETTYEPLSIIPADYLVSCAIYARENGLLDTPKGIASSRWQNGTSAIFKWPTKPSSSHTAICRSSNLVTKSHTITQKPCSWTRRMATTSGLKPKPRK